MFTFEEKNYLPDDFFVITRIDSTYAGSGTVLDVIFQTGTTVGSGDRFLTGSVGEELVEKVHRLAKGSNAGKRTKVSAAVIGESTGDVGTRPFFRNGDFEIGIALIVFEANVVSRFVFLNEVIFKYYGFLLGICDDEVDICYQRGQFSKFMS